MQANEGGSADVPLKEIMKQLYDAAESDSWRPGSHVVTKEIPVSVTSAVHTADVRRALSRAAAKSFVNAAKPLRRLLRNQGAVNDSLIEALWHLSLQAEEMLEEISRLQRRMAALEAKLLKQPAEQIHSATRSTAP